MTRHSLIGIEIERAVGAVLAEHAVLALSDQGNIHVVFLVGKQNGEGVQEAHLSFASAHGFDRGGFTGADFDLVGQAGHLAEAVGHFLAALGDLANIHGGTKVITMGLSAEPRLPAAGVMAFGRGSHLAAGMAVGAAVAGTAVGASVAGTAVGAGACVGGSAVGASVAAGPQAVSAREKQTISANKENVRRLFIYHLLIYGT